MISCCTKTVYQNHDTVMETALAVNGSGLCRACLVCKWIWIIKRILLILLSVQRYVDHLEACTERVERARGCGSSLDFWRKSNNVCCWIQPTSTKMYNLPVIESTAEYKAMHWIHWPCNLSYTSTIKNICAYVNRIMTMRLQTPESIKVTLVSQRGGS